MAIHGRAKSSRDPEIPVQPAPIFLRPLELNYQLQSRWAANADSEIVAAVGVQLQFALREGHPVRRGSGMRVGPHQCRVPPRGLE